MKSVLELLRAYAAFQEREHPRDQQGRFAHGTRHYDKTAPLSGSPLVTEARELAEGRRSLKRDRVAGLDVTSGLDAAHAPHPVVAGMDGGNVERGHYQLIKSGDASGFTITQAQPHSPVFRALQGGGPAFTYAYYDRGLRGEGQPNAKHLPALEAHLRSLYGDRAEIGTSAHAGHVKNFGWDSEDHMERVHWDEAHLRSDPDTAHGVERSAQRMLAVVPHASLSPLEARKVVTGAYHAAHAHAAETGYLWDAPDARVMGVPGPPPKGQHAHKAVTIPGLGGLYTMIYNPREGDAGEHLAQALGGQVTDLWLPEAWSGFLGGAQAEHVDAALGAMRVRPSGKLLQ